MSLHLKNDPLGPRCMGHEKHFESKKKKDLPVPWNDWSQKPRPVGGGEVVKW